MEAKSIAACVASLAPVASHAPSCDEGIEPEGIRTVW